MFLYYLLHSFKNQIRKLLKTWVFIFLVCCMLIGGVIGAGTAVIIDKNEENSLQQITGEEQLSDLTEIESVTDIINVEKRSEIIELTAGILIILAFAIMILMGDTNGASVFLPADVNLLFPSPLRPQSVLLFRVSLQLGGMLFFMLYLILISPDIFVDSVFNIFVVLSCIVTCIFTLFAGQICRIAVYIVGATYGRIRRGIRYTVFGVLFAIAVSFMIFWQTCGGQPLDSAIQFFNSPASRFIPVWGWLKGIIAFTLEGNYMGSILMCGLLIFTLGISIYLIWNFKADFYEDAMLKSEQTAQMTERAQGRSGIVQRTKERSDKIKRDGIKHGKGASVFFFKTLYNRFRFAKFYVFTKTSETYLAAAVIVSVLVLKMDAQIGFTAVALVIGAMSFYRSLSNPLEQDLSMPYFRMAPDSIWKKLMFSILGGSAETFLDLLPAMAVGMIILRVNPLIAAGWILFIITLNFYSTTVGAFICTSVPVEAGIVLKQIVQVMFVYFGLLPDAGIIAAGYVRLGGLSFEISLVMAAVLNVCIGVLVSTLIPLFIIPGSIRTKENIKVLSAEENKAAKKSFSKTGLFLFVYSIVSILVQLIIMVVVEKTDPSIMENEIITWLVTFAPMYLVALPLSMIVVRKVPCFKVDKEKLPFKKLLLCIPVAILFMYVGNLAGIAVGALMYVLTGISMINPVQNLLMDTSMVFQILFAVIIGPIVEEFIFRKTMIDRLRGFGEKRAVIVTAILFGLFHGNISQMFYAAALGLIFGYVYIRTGYLRYSIFLHVVINFLGGIVGQYIMVRGPVYMAVYGGVILFVVICGGVILCRSWRNIQFDTAVMELNRAKRFSTIWINPGMILFLITAGFMIFSPYF